MKRLVRGAARQRSERGAVALMLAVSMTTLVIAAGLVLDFGLARYERQVNKSTADSAALAGLQALDVGDGSYHPWKGVCTALAYLKANDSRLDTMTGTYKNGAGTTIGGACSAGVVPQDAPCVANLSSSWAWYSGTADSGRIKVDIRSGYALPDLAFADDASLTADNGDPAKGGCDQLAVIVQQTDKPGLGSLATSSDLVTRVRSVARLSPNSSQEAPVALLLLERHNCLTLVAGSSNTRFDILGNGPSPGLIHSDSLGDYVGSGSDCNSGNKVLYGKFAGNIVARHAETGALAGVITTVAASGVTGAVAANASDGAANVCAEQTNGSCAAAAGRSVVGRAPFDIRYLTGVRAAMSSASTAMAWTIANALYTVYTPLSCNNLTGTPPPIINSTLIPDVFVNCPGGVSFRDFTFSNATNVVFNGPVSISSGKTLAIPNAQRIYVKGAVGGTGLDVQGNLSLNSGTSTLSANAGTTPLCPARTTAPRNQLVIGNGAFASGASSSLHLCHTTVLLADGWNGTTGCALPASVTPLAVEPSDNSCNGYISLGGQGAMDWTAPNLVTGTSTSTDWNQLEDLALWTETSGTLSSSASNKIGGGGVMSISGVFFLPNANPFTISGGGLQSNGANAQFVARRVQASGQGILYMRPNVADIVTIPLAATVNLVR